MRGEPEEALMWQNKRKISTHSPHAGRTRCRQVYRSVSSNFNSLAPCGANRVLSDGFGVNNYFNSLAPCGANLFGLVRQCGSGDISTHSPHAGRTIFSSNVFPFYRNFNSLAPCGANRSAPRAPRRTPAFQLTRPVRGEPSCCKEKLQTKQISTHSPRAGRTVLCYN